MICHPVVVRAKSDDISWYILTSLDPRLDPMPRNVKLEIAVREFAEFGD